MKNNANVFHNFDIKKATFERDSEAFQEASYHGEPFCINDGDMSVSGYYYNGVIFIESINEVGIQHGA